MYVKIDAIAVASSDLEKTMQFYQLLGFTFNPIAGDEKHVEAVTEKGEVRLIIDTKELIQELYGVEPTPSNHSVFAMLCESPSDVDSAVQAIQREGFVIVKEPFDAFWGQRYATVQDPDGYMIDIFAEL